MVIMSKKELLALKNEIVILKQKSDSNQDTILKVEEQLKESNKLTKELVEEIMLFKESINHNETNLDATQLLGEWLYGEDFNSKGGASGK